MLETRKYRGQNGRADATMCRKLAVEACERAAQTTDPELRTSFMSMNELWLDLAREIDRRQIPSGWAAGLEESPHHSS